MLKNILCIDVGRGTQDILYFRGESNLENCTVFVVPSRTGVLSEKLKQCVENGMTPLFTGRNMGGFKAWRICQEYLEKGGKIFADRESAKTFHDDLEHVEKNGITIVSPDTVEKLKKDKNVFTLQTQDVMLSNLEHALRLFDSFSPIEGIAVAVQDHGEASPGQSNRVFRFQNYKRVLETKPNILEFTYWAAQIPKRLTRMRSVAESLPSNIPLLLMDTGIAAILGCLEDPLVKKTEKKVILNIGNGHTVAACLFGEKIVGYFEHHTNSLDDLKIRSFMKRFAEGELEFEDVFEDGGHGVYTSPELKNSPISDYLLTVTGPRRSILNPQGVHLSSPHGNMMITGSYGLLKAFIARS